MLIRFSSIIGQR